MRHFTVILFILLSGCATTSVFENVESATDPTYGYRPENPIQIGYWNMQKSMEASYFYVTHLVTDDHRPLKFIMHATVDDPIHDPEKITIPRRYGPLAGLSETGGLLDAYVLVAKGTSDTLTLYFDTFHEGPILVPQGLQFIPPQ